MGETFVSAVHPEQGHAIVEYHCVCRFSRQEKLPVYRIDDWGLSNELENNHWRISNV